MVQGNWKKEFEEFIYKDLKETRIAIEFNDEVEKWKAKVKNKKKFIPKGEQDDKHP